MTEAMEFELPPDSVVKGATTRKEAPKSFGFNRAKRARRTGVGDGKVGVTVWAQWRANLIAHGGLLC